MTILTGRRQVNLAARLMMVAGGPGGESGILCDERTHDQSVERTVGQATFDGPEQLAVKKRKDPLTAYRPRRDATLTRLGSWKKNRGEGEEVDEPLVGRDGELMLLRAELQRAIGPSLGSGGPSTPRASESAQRRGKSCASGTRTSSGPVGTCSGPVGTCSGDVRTAQANRPIL